MTWLRNAMIALGLLAVCAAAVSWTAQYRLVFAVKHLSLVAALEAAIPDAAAFIFASLGIALALHGRRAIRPRVLNVAAVGVSIFMNAIAAASGWQDMAVWVMPAVAYAVASDTLIGVIRAWALARARALDARLADDETTPLAAVGDWRSGCFASYWRRARPWRVSVRWVVDEVPFAPGRPAGRRAVASASNHLSHRHRAGRHARRTESKTAKFLDLVIERHGPLAAFPLERGLESQQPPSRRKSASTPDRRAQPCANKSSRPRTVMPNEPHRVGVDASGAAYRHLGRSSGSAAPGPPGTPYPAAHAPPAPSR